MGFTRAAAVVFGLLSLGVAAFQVALALGAPWGSYAMGGSFPGMYPPGMRVGAVVQAVLILFVAAIVLARAGLILPTWSRISRRLIWVVVGFGAVGLVLNTITPSSGERLVWAPVALVLLVCSVVVARSGVSSGVDDQARVV
jgi:hypothetical protein